MADEKQTVAETETPIAYGECRACAWGGPACTDPRAWPLTTPRQVELAERGKLKCPKCRKSDSGVFEPDGDFLRRMEQREHIAEIKRLREKNKRLEVEAAKARPQVPPREPEKGDGPPRRGQRT